MKKSLAVFDFDHTLIDDNSDTAIILLTDKNTIPEEVRDLHKKDGWTAFMQGIFTLLHDRGITPSRIKNLIATLPPVEGMPQLIKELKRLSCYDTIIISDSNSCFIDVWLENQNLKDCVTQVFSNPVEIVDGMFNISMYHYQETCKLSTKNLCKGRVLDEFLEEQRSKGVEYDRIVYCGDGANDFCPVLHLTKNDLACVRKNYKLSDLVTKAKKGKSFDSSGKPHHVHAEVLVWNSGADILKEIKK